MLGTSPRTLPESVNSARKVLDKRGFAALLAALDELLDQNPTEEALHALRALALQWTGQPEAAQRLAEERLKLHPSASMTAVAAEIAHIAGDLDQAQVLLTKAQVLDPDDFLVLRQQANWLGVQALAADAVAVHVRSLELYPEMADCYSGIITAWQGIGDSTKAQQALDQAPAWFVGTAQYHNKKGMVALQKHQLAEAEEELRLAVAECPEGGAYWANLGMALGHLAKFDESERACQFALDVNPRNPIALRALAKVAKHRGDIKAAEDFERRATHAIPAMKHCGLFAKANSLSAAGKPLEAVKVLREMVRLAPVTQSRVALIQIPNLLMNAGDWKGARQAHEEAKARLADSTSLRIHEFRFLVHDGRIDDARILLDELLAQDPQDAEVFPLAVQFYLEHGATASADALVARIQQELPGTPSLVAAVIMKLIQHNRRDQARALHEAATRRYPEHETFRMIALGFASEDNDMQAVARIMKTLPPSSRPHVSLARVILSKQFWKAFLRAFKSRRKPRR